MKIPKDENILRLESLIRGYDFGKRSVKTFKSCMKLSHSYSSFQDLNEQDGRSAAMFGLVSPIGEIIGWIRHPIDLVVGYYHYQKNRNKYLV